MMCAIFLSHFVFAVFWRTLVAFGFVFHHDWFCRLYIRENCDYDVFYYTCKEEMEPVLITVRELIELINERINDSASKR